MTKSLKRIDRVIIDSRDPITGLKTGNMRGAPHRDTRYDESLTKIINDPDPQSSLSIDFLPLTILFSLLSSVGTSTGSLTLHRARGAVMDA